MSALCNASMLQANLNRCFFKAVPFGCCWVSALVNCGDCLCQWLWVDLDMKLFLLKRLSHRISRKSVVCHQACYSFCSFLPIKCVYFQHTYSICLCRIYTEAEEPQVFGTYFKDCKLMHLVAADPLYFWFPFLYLLILRPSWASE